MLFQDLCQVRHRLRVDVRRQVNEGAVLAVVGKLVVGEADALERVRKHVAGDADTDLLAERIAHGLPFDFNARLLHHGVKDDIIIIAAAQGAHAGKNIEFRLAGIGVRGGGGRCPALSVAAGTLRSAAGAGGGAAAAAGQHAKGHHGCQAKGKDPRNFRFLHNFTSSLLYFAGWAAALPNKRNKAFAPFHHASGAMERSNIQAFGSLPII